MYVSANLKAVSLNLHRYSVGGGGDKKSYQGAEYDYVFDVDIQEGAPALKLPFNKVGRCTFCILLTHTSSSDWLKYLSANEKAE